MSQIPEALTFDDLLLVPQYSEVESRSTVDISSQLGPGLEFALPIISSPMDRVTGADMAMAMARRGGLGIIHRNMKISEQAAAVEDLAGQRLRVGAAVGITGDYMERAIAALKAGATVICADVAHGDHVLMKRALENLGRLRGDFKFHLMAGNVATGDGFVRLAQWGADSVRVGIGSGSICSTRVNTGHGMPNLSLIWGCLNAWSKLGTWSADPDSQMLDVYPDIFTPTKMKRPSIIIDGGIRNAGDIVKALAVGADFVMCGSLLAGTDESPGEVIEINGKKVKEYRGMASKESQLEWRGYSSAPEGIATHIPYKGSVEPILDDLAGNIRSGFSYSNAKDVSELRKNAQWVRQTFAGLRESQTHILEVSIK